MSAVSLRLPDSIHRRIRELAQAEGVSINHLITTALVEKLSALRAEEYLSQRASRGTPENFDRVLAGVRDVAPLPEDRLPRAPARRTTPRRPPSKRNKGGLAQGRS
jgi:hypothetical protein